jgi:hypothetical protein
VFTAAGTYRMGFNTVKNRSIVGSSVNLKLALAASALALISVAPASAAITITATAPFPPNPSENVLLNQTASGMTILGATNQTNTAVKFTGNETLIDPPQGQAVIKTTDGTLNFLNISLTDPTQGFGKFEFNLDGATTGLVHLAFTDQLGQTFGGDFTVDAHGSNFFDAVASNGELITNVQLTGVNGYNVSDVGQVRLGGFGLASGVPESATWAMLIVGFGGIGGLRRATRRSHRPFAA